MRVDYLETYGGPLDTEKGWQYGGQTSFTVQRDWLRLSNLYFSGTFTWTHATITHGHTKRFSLTISKRFPRSIGGWSENRLSRSWGELGRNNK